MRAVIILVFAILTVKFVWTKPTTTAPNPKEILDDLLNKMEGLQTSLKKILPTGKDVSKSVINLSEDIARNVEKFTKTINSQEIISNVEKDISLQLGNFVAHVNMLMNEIIPESAKKSFANIEQQASSIYTEAQQLQKTVQASLEDAQHQMERLVVDFYKYVSTAGARLKTEIEIALQ